MSKRLITVDGKDHLLDVADTPALRAKGLSGLSSSKGMIFEFPKGSTSPFTMKGMEFDIQIIWYTYAMEEIKRQTYSRGFEGPIFCFTPYHYVVELPVESSGGSDVRASNIISGAISHRV